MSIVREEGCIKEEEKGSGCHGQYLRIGIGILNFERFLGLDQSTLVHTLFTNFDSCLIELNSYIS